MTNASEWTGPVGDVWAAEWRRTDRSFASLASHLDAAILAHAPKGKATVVDIGCGAGATSAASAEELPQASVTGIDISPGLIGVARNRWRDRANLDFLIGPVEEKVGHVAPVDLFASRHGVMFFADPVVAFTRIRAAAAPGAALVFSCFRAVELNPWARDIAAAVKREKPPPSHDYAPGPFAFADPDLVTSILIAAGWTDIDHRPADFCYRAGEGAHPVADAVSFFEQVGPAAPTLRAAPADDRAGMIDRISAVVERHRSGNVVEFPAAAWLWSAKTTG